jgi:hypothetical protein
VRETDRWTRLRGNNFPDAKGQFLAIDAAATANNSMAVYGDIAKAFFIVDRVGFTLEIIPNLIGANQRPTGERGSQVQPPLCTSSCR